MGPIGARLKKLRLEKGLSIEEVHKKTKIHLNILKAIEEDKYAHINPVYLKGFLKIYAKFLGVDSHNLIPGYREPQKETKVKIKSPLFKGPAVKVISFKNLAIKIKTVLFVGVAIIFIIGLFNLGKTLASKRQRLSKETKTAAVIPAKTKKETKVKVAPKAKVSTLIRLGIRAKDNCWLQIKTDGRVVFKNILKKGSSESWQAKEKIELSVGNAGVIDLEINGKPIPRLGRRGQVLKNILITSEGLNIPR
jgi:cytoskeletal protein RodZ